MQTSSNTTVRSRRGRLVWVFAIMVATVAGTASPAWAAHSVTRGTTSYASGSPQSGPFGTWVTISANGALPYTVYNIATGDPTPGRPCGSNITFDDDVVDYRSDANGNIASATFTIDRAPGNYNLCFYERVTPAEANDPNKTVTAPVNFMVTTCEDVGGFDPPMPPTTC